MRTELKKAIINHIFENLSDFQLVNNTTHKFRAYIYDGAGNYLIGGEDGTKFISESIKLIK